MACAFVPGRPVAGAAARELRKKFLSAHYLDKVGAAPILCLTKQITRSFPQHPRMSHLESSMPTPIADEILESYCTDSRVHALINNPITEGIDEG